MSASTQQVVEKAIAMLPKRHVFKTANEEFEVCRLFHVHSWRPHMESCPQAGALILGEDSCGNFFLCASDGSVSFWDHETGSEKSLAATVEEFCGLLVAPAPIVLRPDQVQSVWIDPVFFAEQMRDGNAR